MRSAHSGAVRIWFAVVAYSGVGRIGNAVARADVVQQEVAVRVDDLVAERRRHDERAAVDRRARRGAVVMDVHVARRAADLVEHLLAGRTSAVIGPRDGAFVERMKSANAIDVVAVVLGIGNRIVAGAEPTSRRSRCSRPGTAGW